jgi:hypothetical protein
MGEPTAVQKDRSGIFDELRATLDKRIMFFDGGMGTMIQQLYLSEEDFRGILQGLPDKTAIVCSTCQFCQPCFVRRGGV